MTPISDTPPPRRFVLRDLTLPARLVLTVFMLSVGIGYVSAIINLHLQEASPGEPLPTRDDVIKDYHGTTNISQLERLLTAHESLPFNGQGSMRAAFTRTRAGGIDRAITLKAADRAQKENRDPNDPELTTACEIEVLKELDGERQALVAWIRAGYPRSAYEEDAFPIKSEVSVTPRFVDTNKTNHSIKIRSILESRCVRCHSASAGGAGSQYPLDSYETVATYCRQPAPSGKSLAKLALSTHVHLLGFSMLYGLTGLVLAFSRLPFLLRLVLCPLPLVAQVLDISCWWLARLDGHLGETFASIIPLTGGVVALGLVVQILISVFDMYDWTGRFVLVLLFLGAGAGGGFLLQHLIHPWLENEKTRALEQPVEQKAEEKKPEAKKPQEKKPEEKPLHNEPPSKLEKLLTPNPRQTNLEFNGEGQMSKAFINEKWEKTLTQYKKEHPELTPEAADAALYAEREGERQALLGWIRAGGPQEAYDKDAFVLPAGAVDHPLTPKYRDADRKAARIKSIITDRCVRCHSPEGMGEAVQYPLDSYDELKKYLAKKVGGGQPNKPVAASEELTRKQTPSPAEGQQTLDAVLPPGMSRLPRRRYRRAG
jgi:mono/diheme cytochrome c family protein